MHSKLYLAKLLLATLFTCCCLITNGQQIIQQKISQEFATAQDVATYTPLTAVEANTLKNNIPESMLSQKQFFQIETQEFQTIKENKAEQLVISLPIEGQEVAFQLIKAKLFSDDFQVVAASGASLSQDMGVHYWGVATGDSNSFATFSFMNNELAGGMHFAGQHYTLGKMQNSDTHILYNNADLNNDVEFTCQELLPPGMSLEDIPQPDEQVLKNSAANCVRIHMEVDYSLYLSANRLCYSSV